MTSITDLIGSVNKNVLLLVPPKEPILPVKYEISSTSVKIQSPTELDLLIYAKSVRNGRIEYASIDDYWLDTRQTLFENAHPALLAKKVLEFRATLVTYDKTTTPDGKFQMPQRSAILDALTKRLFHQKEELRKIYSHHAKFAEGVHYRIDFRGVKDE